MLMMSHLRIQSSTFKMAGIVDSLLSDLSLITEWTKLLDNNRNHSAKKLFFLLSK